MKIFLTGDVMFGRGIDQILEHPGNPEIHEQWMQSSQDYVAIAEQVNGPVPRGVGLDYVWGHAFAVMEQEKPSIGIVNLETAVTARGAPEPKGINYRMNPPNAAKLAELGIGCCVLANNHVLDWGRDGLCDTLDTLRGLRVATAGAGRGANEAASPAVIPVGAGRLLVFGFASRDSGVPGHWAARPDRPGVNMIDISDPDAVGIVARSVARIKRKGDIAVASIHWGGNWGYGIDPAHAFFAHSVIDDAEIDLVHGHSAHHVKGFEIHNSRLILYGCGDFVNDYEGIGGQEEYRPYLSVMYIPTLDDAGRLKSLAMAPFRIRNFRLNRAAAEEASWLCRLMNEQRRDNGPHVVVGKDGNLKLETEACRPNEPSH